VPFTLVHAKKYRTEDKLKIQTTQKLNTTEKKQTKQNYPGLVGVYDTRPGNEVSLFCNAPKPTQGNFMLHKLQYTSFHIKLMNAGMLAHNTKDKHYTVTINI